MISGIGIDIVDIERINALIQRYGMRFLERIFTPKEIETCMKRYDSASCIAGRFAAKEAAFKALGAGRSSGIGFKDISVELTTGIPRLCLTGKAYELSEGLGITRLNLSISHDKGCAVAVVILEAP